MQCQEWNSGRDAECFRCGCRPELDPYYRRSRRDDYVRGQQEGGDPTTEVDEFGRVLPNQSSCSGGGGPPKKKRAPWPPEFETNGSKYVFDNRSEMFYEGKSDFFYDPKTKLYYGNAQQTYYQYKSDEGKFVAVDKPKEPELQAVAVPEPKKISIHLKTKSLKKPKKTKDPKIGDKAAKQHANDMVKWKERQQQQQEGGHKTSAIVRTAKGEPICTLCRRKFPTLEKLQYHEQMSTLHKDNLQKQLASQHERQTAYVDRAQQRRELHGGSLDLPATTTTISSSTMNVPRHQQTIVTQSSQGSGDLNNDNNVGKKMLQKLGWKGGEDTDDHPMKKNWDRIEDMASRGGGGGRGGGSSGVGK